MFPNLDCHHHHRLCLCSPLLMSSEDHRGSSYIPPPPPAGALNNERDRNVISPFASSPPVWRNPFTNPQSSPPRRVSLLPIAPNEDDRRDSQATIITAPDDEQDPYSKYALSSYQHPYDIPPPPNAYGGSDASQVRNRGPMKRSVSFAPKPGVKEFDDNSDEDDYDPEKERAEKHRGIPSQMLDLRELNREDGESFQRPGYGRKDSTFSNASEGLDPDDPLVTGARARYLEDTEDVEKNALRQMDYKARRKHLMRVKIEFNVTCTTISSFAVGSCTHCCR